MEALLALGEDAEDPGQGRQRGRQLVLQHVPMLLLQDAAWKGQSEELLDRLQVRVGASYADHDGVAISEPKSREAKSKGRILRKLIKRITKMRGPRETQRKNQRGGTIS